MIEMLRLLIYSDTKPTRFWLALLCLGYALHIMLGPETGGIMEQRLELNSNYAYLMWGSLYILNGIVLLIGLFRPFDYYTLIFEIVLGWGLWMAAAVANSLVDGYPGPYAVIALMMTWVFIRAPTHWGQNS